MGGRGQVYGDRGDVTVRVPRLKRLRDAIRVMHHLFPKMKSHGWVVEPAYMLKRASMLDKALWDLSVRVDKVFVSFAYAIWFNDLLLSPPGTTLENEVPLPDMDVPEGITAAAALLQEVHTLGDDKKGSEAAGVALLRGLLGAGNGTVRISELRKALIGMDDIFSQITALAAWTTNHQACRDLALSGHKMIQALGILQLPRDTIPLSSESLAARRSRLERLQLPMWHFKEAIEAVSYAGVIFQGYPTVQNLQMHLPAHVNAHVLQNYLQHFHAYGPNAGALNDHKVLGNERARLYESVLDDDFSSQIPLVVPSDALVGEAVPLEEWVGDANAHYADLGGDANAHYAEEADLGGDDGEEDGDHYAEEADLGGDDGEEDGDDGGEWNEFWCHIM
ncbi:unnamed protein product [Urochloa humidicola]